MTEAAFDQLLRRLSEAGVDFVLIGGLAVNAWGVVRGTKDVGVVVAPNPENLKRLAEVAVEARGHVQTGESFLSTPFSIAAQLASGERVAIETEILDVKVSICSIDDLRQMKRAAGRPRDSVDLEDLDAAGQ